MLFSTLHKATVDSDTASRSFLQIMESEVEPAIKELSSCLLAHRSGPMEVEKCLQKFDAALAHMRNMQEQVQASMHHVQKVGEKLLK